MFSGAAILCGECGDAVGNALLRQSGVIINPVYCVKACHSIDSHGIYRSLNQKFSYRLAGLLQGGDAAVADRLF